MADQDKNKLSAEQKNATPENSKTSQPTEGASSPPETATGTATSSKNVSPRQSGDRGPQIRSASLGEVTSVNKAAQYALVSASSEGTGIDYPATLGTTNLQLPQASIPIKRTFSGRHRNSGLFSADDLSVDMSVTDSQGMIGNYIDARRASPRIGSITRVASIQAEEAGKHPASILGSASIGSSSSDLYPLGESGAWYRKHRYRPFRRKWRRFQRKYKGCIFALLSSILSSLGNHFVHKLTTESGKDGDGPVYDASYCLLWRYFGVLFPGIFILMYYRCCKKEMVLDTVWPLSDKEALKRFGLSIVSIS